MRILMADSVYCYVLIDNLLTALSTNVNLCQVAQPQRHILM